MIIGLKQTGTSIDVPHQELTRGVKMRKNENGLPIKEIDLKLISDEVISRAVLNQETAIEYGCLMEAGTIFPPIEVFEKGDGTYIIGDGRTRYHAANLCNKITINCVVHPENVNERNFAVRPEVQCGIGRTKRLCRCPPHDNDAGGIGMQPEVHRI